MSGYFGTVPLALFSSSVSAARARALSSASLSVPLPFVSSAPSLDSTALACHSFARCPSPLHVILTRLLSRATVFFWLSLIHHLPGASPPAFAVLLSFARERLAYSDCEADLLKITRNPEYSRGDPC